MTRSRRRDEARAARRWSPESSPNLRGRIAKPDEGMSRRVRKAAARIARANVPPVTRRSKNQAPRPSLGFRRGRRAA